MSLTVARILEAKRLLDEANNTKPRQEEPVKSAVDSLKDLTKEVESLEKALEVANDTSRKQRERADRLEAEKERLSETVTAYQRDDRGQRALLVYRDGRMQVKPLQVEPDASKWNNIRPVRRIEMVDAPLYSLAYHRLFEVAPNQPQDAKLIVYTER